MSFQCSGSDFDLTDFVLDQLDGAARREAEDHIARCARCRGEAESIRSLIETARDLPRLAVSKTFHQSLIDRIRREKEVSLSFRDRALLNTGFVLYRLRQSAFARILLVAAAIQAAVFLAVVIFSERGATEGPEPGEGDAAAVHYPEKFAPYRENDEELVELLPEEPFGGKNGLGVDELEAPQENFRSPVDDEELFIPEDDISDRIERENILELSLYRMSARLNPPYKKRAMKGRGGDSRTAIAVDRGLKWLRYHQEKDGSWDPESYSGGGRDFGGDPRARVGLSALAVAAFLSDGHTEVSGRYSDTVSKGIRFILASQDGSGRFGGVDESPAVSLFNQSVSVLVLAENFILTGGLNGGALDAGTKRLARMMRSYPPEETHDAYSDTWASMALHTVLMTGQTGLETAEVVRDIESRVALLARQEDHTMPFSKTLPFYSAGAVAVCRLFPAEEGEEEALDPDFVPFPDRDRPETMLVLLDDPDLREPSFLFFISTALVEDSNPFWPVWNRRVKSLLMQQQKREGYWPAGGDWPWIDGGDIYQTSLSILTLQIYYRFIKLDENGK